MDKISFKDLVVGYDPEGADELVQYRRQKRRRGLFGEAKGYVRKEETVNELNSTTLKSYLDKAEKSKERHIKVASDARNQSYEDHLDGKLADRNREGRKSTKNYTKAAERGLGIKLAKKRLKIESVEELDEALNMAQRLKRSRTMRRVQKKVQMGRKRAMRKMANIDTLKRRSHKSARKELLKKLTKGIPKDKLSPSRKAELEKRLNSPAMKKRIAVISRKMLKDVRKREVVRHKGK